MMSGPNSPKLNSLDYQAWGQCWSLNKTCNRSQNQFPSFTRNSSGDEIANVNFVYDDIVHVLQNTIDLCINSATDRRGYVLERMCLPHSVK